MGRPRGLARVRHAARQASLTGTGNRAQRGQLRPRLVGVTRRELVRSSGAPPGAEPATAPIPLAKPLLGEAEERAVVEVLRSGRLSLGGRVGEFEQLFAGGLGAGHGSAVGRGTAGLHLALRAVGVQDGDEVVTSPFSFVASANVAVYERARPVFADIDPVTLNLEPGAAAAAVSERTTALLPVHIFGYPAEMPA